ncbi:MAG: tRNA (adenosine(37)-N6)-threonylcarbamoyltransferase complex dimerization subunit type 1 TsaB [Candidatus Baltobacteraceae bacterium]
MTTLGIDGALGSFSCAVAEDGRTLAALELPGNIALEQGLPAIAFVMQQAGLGSAELDRIGVGIGPGSFTGLRIVVSYAKSLAQAWKKPLVGVSSFDSLEANVAALGLLTVVSARPGVISVRYRHAGTEHRRSGRTADVLDAIESLFIESGEPKRLKVLGAPEDVLAGLGERGFNVQILEPLISPAALAVAQLACEFAPAASLHAIRADYGELPAAKLPR